MILTASRIKRKRAGGSVKKAEESIDAGIAEVRKRLEFDGTAMADLTGGRKLNWETAIETKEERGERVSTSQGNSVGWIAGFGSVSECYSSISRLQVEPRRCRPHRELLVGQPPLHGVGC